MPKLKANAIIVVSLFFVCIGVGLWNFVLTDFWDRPSKPIKSLSSPTAIVSPSGFPATTTKSVPENKSFADLLKAYGSVPLADAHNHDASDSKYLGMQAVWKRAAMDRVILFGDVSERSAIRTDENAWSAYRDRPDFYIPYFSGFDLHDNASLEIVRKNLEQGYFGLGEIAAASYNSPVVSKVEWKAKDPMDGYLPQIYDLCAEYQAPILLHMDPPNGFVIDKLEEALDSHPKTTFIFAHANAYNSPGNIRKLVEKHANVYMDFFAGFTILNPESTNQIEDFLPIMREFPDRFMLSTDSGYGVASEESAIEAMYRVLDAIGDPVLIRQIAYDNLDVIIRNEPATKTQKDAVLKQDPTRDITKLTKLEAGKILLGK